MSLDQIITVNITRDATTISQVGFGTANLVGYFPTSIFSERSRTFSTLQGLKDVGFKVSDPVYGMASNLLAQNPSPSEFKVGRRVGAPQQILEITPTNLEVGSVHTVTVSGFKDTVFADRESVTDEVSYTTILNDTATLICDGLRAAFAALNSASGQAGDWDDAGTATLTITAKNTDNTMDGLLFNVTYVADGVPVGVDDNTVNPSVKIATDLGDINTYDNDWYALAIDSNSGDEITGGATAEEGAADWVESNTKIMVCQTQDVDVANDEADVTSVAYVLQNTGYDRTMLFFHRGNMDRVDTAMLGVALPADPGSLNWGFQDLASVSAQDLTESQMSTLMGTIASPTGGKNVNTLTALAGVNVTRYGRVSSGEWIDNIRYTDFLAARIQERVYGVLISNPKVPYTDSGIALVKNEILAQLDHGIGVGALSEDPPPTCTVPRASDVSAANKANRLLDDVTFRATLAGAVNYVAIDGHLAL
jgi:hypothetical protein